MKKFYTLLAVILISPLGFAQNYNIGQTTGTNSPYLYNTSGTTVLALPADDILSSWQTIPFSFEFFGQAVTGYYASENGYITFDNGASTGDPNNTTLPNAGGPNDAIYAFWDDFELVSGSGSTDEIRSFNYGTSPNQVHVIQWYSITDPISGDFVYMAIRLYECGDFDIIHNYGNASGLTGTVGCEDATGANGVQVSGSPSLDHPGNGSAGDDDVVYTFYYDQNMYDVSVSALDLDSYVSVGNNTVSGTITNYGSQAITSLDLHYTVDAGPNQTDNITGINIPANGGTYSFSHATPWNVAAGGVNHDLCVWADNLNSGNSDQRSCNDQICETLFSNNGTSGTLTVLIEEFTGAWCGFCPDGALRMQTILDNNPGDVIGVSVHDGDAMEFNDGIRTDFNVTGYPTGMVHRVLFDGETKEPHSRSAWDANTTSLIGSYTPVDVSISHTYNPTTRVIDMTVTADFVDFAAGDLRIGAMVVESNVTGSGSGYDQVNYYSSQGSAVGGSGHPHYNDPDPIVGYVHNHVLRALPGGTYGNSGIIPATVNPSSQYTENFSYTLPTTYKAEDVHIVGFVAYYSTDIGSRAFLDAAEEDIDDQTSITEIPLVSGIELYPNPAVDNFTLSFNMLERGQASVAIYDAFGKKVQVINEGSFSAGENVITDDISGLANGVYYVSIITDKGHAYTRPLTIAR